jgi:hypothetical protein
MTSLLKSSVSGVCVCVCGWVAVAQGDIIFGTGKEFPNTFPYILIAYVIILA